MSTQLDNILPEPEDEAQLFSKQFRTCLIQIVLISIAILTTYFWLSVPFLRKLSIQAFAISILVYFLLKKLNKIKFWLLPNSTLDEMMIVTFAFLLLIGATENINSIFFPMIYVYIFFISLCCEASSAIVITLEVVLFHYALNGDISLQNLSRLLSIPMVMLFFLFTKQQYDQVQKNQQTIEMNQQQIKYYQDFVKNQNLSLKKLENQDTQESGLKSFLSGYVSPALQQLQKLSKLEKNKIILQRQLTILSFEIDKLLKKNK
jgi:hypothetical protein